MASFNAVVSDDINFCRRTFIDWHDWHEWLLSYIAATLASVLETLEKNAFLVTLYNRTTPPFPPSPSFSRDIIDLISDQICDHCSRIMQPCTHATMQSCILQSAADRFSFLNPSARWTLRFSSPTVFHTPRLLRPPIGRLSSTCSHFTGSFLQFHSPNQEV